RKTACMIIYLYLIIINYIEIMMSERVDFRLLKPERVINKLNGEIEYLIPCTVKQIGKHITGNRYEIEIEHLDFKSGEIITSKGITYKKTIELINDIDKKVPFETSCKISKTSEKTYEFIVYGLYIVGIMELFYDVSEIIN